ncbi:MAG TPA: hypothetical protein PKM50_08385 [Methanoregula sp.]|nr:hypothetical protein [Methanoregula sp.]
MKKHLFFCFILIITGVLAAGCSTADNSDKSPALTKTPAILEVQGTYTNQSTIQPAFSLGGKYLNESYRFNGDTNQYTKQFRVDNQSWAIVFSVKNLSDDPKNCWFEMTVTNLDTNKKQTFGYGRTYSYDTYQQYPMYTPGLYEIVMNGNSTKVSLDIAKRLP